MSVITSTTEKIVTKDHSENTLENWIINNTFSKLFFRRKFFQHRIAGLLFLIQYALAIYLYVKDYPTFIKSPLILTLPLTGVFQAIIAIYTFTFLPKNKVDPGYFGDKGVLSYNFIKENLFYEIILLFGWLYFQNTFYHLFRATFVIEILFVFFPYYLRSYFPKTRMRDSFNFDNKTDKNKRFFTIATWITKGFYIWGKHYLGFFLNYARYLDYLNDRDIYYYYNMIIAGTCATTIAIFLHTLKFKGYMGPVKSYLIYMTAYFFTFYAICHMHSLFFQHLDLCAIVLIGLILNFFSRRVQLSYQMIVLILLTSKRYGYLETTSILN